MNKLRRSIVALTCILYVFQVIAIFVSGSQASASSATASPLVSLLAAAGMGAIDVATVRYLLAAMRRSEAAYAARVSEQLESSLERYRKESEHEGKLIKQVGTAIDAELSEAQRALESGDFAIADQHLRTSLRLASQTKTVACDNIYVSAVLESKLHQCAEAGVTLRPQVTLPAELPIQDIDVASIFFNLIDNALHECEALAAVGSPRDELTIDVHGMTQAGQLFVEVVNPCRTGVNTTLSAARRRSDTRELHGWGTQIVTDIAKRYGGLTNFEEHDGRFVAQAMMPMPDNAMT